MRAIEFLSENIGNKLIPIEGSTVVNYAGRMMVLVDFGSVRIPFYLSTGEGGKATVKSGRWYPFFGVGSDGWINKTAQIDIANYYYNPTLRSVAQKLDAQIGDIRDDARPPRITKAGLAQVNSGLNPVSHGDEGAVYKLIPHIKRLLSSIGGTIAKGQGDPTLSRVDDIISAYKGGKLDWAKAAETLKTLPDPKVAQDYFLFHAAPG